MTLTRLQCRRFFRLLDALTSYANQRLDVVDPAGLEPNGLGGVADPQARAEVSYELWQNLQVIDEFVQRNPAGLSAGELDIAQSWRRGLTDTFLVDFFPDGQIRFVSSGYAFEVTGLSREIANMLGALPAAVHATLLPFDGHIVFADYLGDHLVEFGDGMLDIFEREIARIMEEGRIAHDADELLRIADEIREQTLAHDTAEMIADLERGMFSGDGTSAASPEGEGGPGDGEYDDDSEFAQHRGVLADMSFEERNAAIERHIEEHLNHGRADLVELLGNSCVEGEEVTGLAELLALDDRYDVRRFAKLIGTEAARNASMAEVIGGIVACLASPEGAHALDGAIDGLSPWRIASLRALVERGGRWTVEAADIASLRDLPSYEVGLSYVFREEDSFAFVMPDEVLRIAQAYDWDAALGRARRFRTLIDYADVVVELRGVVPADDLAAEYAARYPEGYAAEEVVPQLMQGVVDGIANFDLLQAEQGLFVLHYELFWAYEDEMGLDRSPLTAEPVTYGELGETIGGLMAQQRGKEARLPTDDMLAARSLLDWKADQGPARAFCQYLDAHVPDKRNDYHFADKAIEELISDAMWGIVDKGAQRLFDILEDNDFIPAADQIQKLLDLWSNLCNGLPVWPNNGWSPNEMLGREHGGALFFNEDGSPMKVGRNDPCPCGSGLKYKKCHGR